MEGLVKSAPVQTVSPQTPVPQRGISGGLEWQSVPIDVFHHFSVDLSSADPKIVDKLRDIYQWASECEDPSLGNILKRINEIENKLGAPHAGEQRFDKMWRWTQLQKRIDDLRKRQDSMRSRWL